MNSITIAGNLGKSAELRHLQNGDAVASFSVADSAGKDKPTVWWSCSMFGKRAEALVDFLQKGSQVTVIGTVTERTWTDKDGNERKSMDVRVSDIKLQGSPKESQENTYKKPSQDGAKARQLAPKESYAPAEDDSDIPF